MKRSRAVRLGLAIILIAHLAIIEYAILASERFAMFPFGGAGASVAIAIPFLIAVRYVVGTGGDPYRLGLLALVVAYGIAARFYSPGVILMLSSAPMRDDSAIAGITDESRLLREVSYAQEQFRTHNARYADSLSDLLPWLAGGTTEINSLLAQGSVGWSASAHSGEVTCWLRDKGLSRIGASADEGVPICNIPAQVQLHERHPTPHRTDCREQTLFEGSDIVDTWPQYRLTPDRAHGAGLAILAAPRWRFVACGELRAQVAAAGNQVFVGAHRNGEVEAIHRQTGRLGWRVRLPNWAHNEPVITPTLVIFGFGNNELNTINTAILGSPPSGVVALSRLTGESRWIFYTDGAVMTTPVLIDSAVIFVTGAQQVIRLRVKDGSEVWRTSLPGIAPMGNPVLADSVLFIGLEKTLLCAIRVRDGHTNYCVRFRREGWGAGHTSASVAGGLVFIATDRGPMSAGALLLAIRERSWKAILVHASGKSSPSNRGDDLEFGEQELSALDASNGSVRWTRSLGSGSYHGGGNIAATAVADGDNIYASSPVSGRVSAFRARDGSPLWTREVGSKRGNVLAIGDRLLVFARGQTYVTLRKWDGTVSCTGRLPADVDRTGATLVGGAIVATFLTGLVVSAPVEEWLSCAVA